MRVSIIFLVMIVLVMTVNICIIVLANAIILSKGENVMDAITFAKEYLRMCGKFSNCEKCPILNTHFCTINAKEEKARIDAGEVVRIIEEWSSAHPCKTRQSVFLEQYPEAEIDLNGLLEVCPAPIFHSHRGKGGGCSDFHKNCAECRREFWLQEVE